MDTLGGTRNEYGEITGSSDTGHFNHWVSLDTVRAALAAYDAARPGLPDHDEKQARLAVGPVIDGRIPVGWFLDTDD